MRDRWIVLLICLAAAVAVGGCKGAGQKAARPPVDLVEPTAGQQEQLAAAYDARDAGDYETALTLFQEILAENPTVVTAYLGIGDIYMVNREYGKAEPAYSRAARLDPGDFDAQYGHGLALQMLDRFTEAVRAYLRALDINPSSHKANLNLATTYLRMEEARNALPYAEEAVRLDPGNGAARVNLGAIYEKLGRDGDAIEEYLVAMELMEDTPPLMMNLINALAREHRYREAVATAEALVKIESSANAYERLGWCYFRLGEFDDSLQAYRRGVQADGEHWPSLNGVGVNALNRWLLSDKTEVAAFEEARHAFRQSLRANPRQKRLITLMSNFGL